MTLELEKYKRSVNTSGGVERNTTQWKLRNCQTKIKTIHGYCRNSHHSHSDNPQKKSFVKVLNSSCHSISSISLANGEHGQAESSLVEEERKDLTRKSDCTASSIRQSYILAKEPSSGSRSHSGISRFAIPPTSREAALNGNDKYVRI